MTEMIELLGEAIIYRNDIRRMNVCLSKVMRLKKTMKVNTFEYTVNTLG